MSKPKTIRLADLSVRQQEAINEYSRLGGFGIDYLARTDTSAALVGKGLLSPVFRVNGFGRQWLTRDGFKVAGVDLATVVEKAHAEALGEHARREADGMQSSAYQYARDVEFTDPPRFPAGTPEYEAYATELHGELEKFAKGNEPYGYDPAPRTLRELITELVTASHGQYAGLPPQTGWTNARRAEQAARATELLGEIEHRFALAVGLMPTEVRQILDGRAS